jgi:hypothetical protein
MKGAKRSGLVDGRVVPEFGETEGVSGRFRAGREDDAAVGVVGEVVGMDEVWTGCIEESCEWERFVMHLTVAKLDVSNG